MVYFASMYEIALFALPFLITFAWAGKQGAPWVPSKSDDLNRFLRLANIQPGQKVYDLGCGDGRVLRAAAEKGAEAYGYEISLLPFFIAKIRCLLSPYRKNCHVMYKNFWSVNLKDADVVYFFLMPKIYQKLKEKFARELKFGAKVIAYVWPIEGWTPKMVDTINQRPRIYLYEK